MTVESFVDREAAVTLFPIAFALDTRFGRCIGVDLAPALAADPRALAALLRPEERAICQGMRGARLVEFTGGRIASSLARAGMAGADGPTLRGPGGAPMAGGVSLSISHTRHLAVALAHDGPGSIGIDVEQPGEDEGDGLLAERILGEAERRADDGGEPIDIRLRLSIKEAAYKALHPRVGHIPFRRITVSRRDGGATGFAVAVAGIADAAVDSRILHGHILSFASVQ